MEKTGRDSFRPVERPHITATEKLFSRVLSEKPAALTKLNGLLKQFEALDRLSQRAVIARLLTTVAETLASAKEVETIDGKPLLPEGLDKLNQAKIFEIVVYNLLNRDVGVGGVSAAQRLNFLKRFAVYLQRQGSSFFATPEELRNLVRDILAETLRRADTPEQDLENFYRTCRRHSGLTTEGQFYDTSGIIDLPVSETDVDSRVGFSHNSLREYLVASSFVEAIESKGADELSAMLSCAVTDVTLDFVVGIAEYRSAVTEELSRQYATQKVSRIVEQLFEIIYHFVRKDKARYIQLLGAPPELRGVDLSSRDIANVSLRSAKFNDCLMQDTDLRGSNLEGADFAGSIIDGSRFDGSEVNAADFTKASVVSIYAYDEFDTRTTSILKGEKAEQWLYSRGATVRQSERLNPHVGKPWYEAAREVTRTLQRRLSGTHQVRSLAKGTDAKYRPFAEEFVDYLSQRGVLKRVVKSKHGGG